MSTSVYVAGLKSNVLSRGTVTVTPSADSKFPASKLYDGEPGSVFKFGSVAANCVVDVDLDEFLGDFETWSQPNHPDGWEDVSEGTGALSEETTNFHGGASALKLTGAGASNTAIARRDIIVQPGEVRQIDVWLRGDGTSPCKMTVRNLQTGKYLTSAGAWSASLVYYHSESGTTYSQNADSFTVEEYATCGRARIVTLRVEIESDGVGYADDCYCWPRVDFASVHGHNIDPLIIPKLQHDANPSYSSVETAATFTLRQPAFMAVLASPITDRYLRFLAEGTPIFAIEIGELWIGQKRTLTDVLKYGFAVPLSMPSDETVTLAGRPLRTPRAYHPTESLELEFIATSAKRDDILEMMHRANWGSDPIVFAPAVDEGAVYLGCFPMTVPGNRALIDDYDMSGIILVGYPFTKRIA